MSIKKNNIFKSETKVNVPKRETTINKKNSFLSDNKKKEVVLKDSDFPELVSFNKENNIELNYKVASLKEIKSEENTYKLPEGWISYKYNENKVIVEPDNSFEETEETPEEYHSSAKKVIEKLIQKWEVYKNNYNEFYGEEEYENLYYISNYDYNSYSDTEDYE